MRWLFLLLAVAAPVRAQDANFHQPPDSLEAWLAARPFDVIDFRGSRGEGDRTQRAALKFGADVIVLAKWAQAAPGGETFNNVPRYEVAAYRVQRLFLDPADYVVPPTVLRAVPIEWYREKIDADVEPTFDHTESVLVVLQYWLNQVTLLEDLDTARFRADTAYARRVGDLNLFTYVIRHSDSNKGNFLISTVAESPRAFSVDNGVAFSMAESERGIAWRGVRVPAVPRATVERLRSLTREELDRALGVVAEFHVVDGELEPAPPGENLRPGAGVRRKDDVIQLGLTDVEIGRMWDRIQDLLRDVDRGRVATF